MPRGVLLDAAERQQIACGIDKKWTATAIAQKLGRHQSVISREINRNGGRDAYCPVRAQQRADRLRSRPQQRKTGQQQSSPRHGERGFDPGLVTTTNRAPMETGLS